MTTTAHRTPIDQLQQRAIEELANNPTITTYRMVDGTPHLLNLAAEVHRRVNYVLAMICDLVGVPDITIDWSEASQ